MEQKAEWKPKKTHERKPPEVRRRRSGRSWFLMNKVEGKIRNFKGSSVFDCENSQFFEDSHQFLWTTRCELLNEFDHFVTEERQMQKAQSPPQMGWQADEKSHESH